MGREGGQGRERGRLLRPATRAWKGRAEWSFLEERRKSCPFLEVDGMAPGGEWK